MANELTVEQMEAYLRDKWVEVKFVESGTWLQIYEHISHLSLAGTFALPCDNPWIDVLQLAYDDTVDRLEQIRQVRAQIDRANELVWDEDDWELYLSPDMQDFDGWDAVYMVRAQCADLRTLALLQAALDTLTAGLKEESWNN